MTSLACNNAPISQGEWFVVLGPEHAQSLANAGLERRDVASYLFDHARIPAGDVPPSLQRAGLGGVDEAVRRRPRAAR